jgi:hypothetical protein
VRDAGSHIPNLRYCLGFNVRSRSFGLKALKKFGTRWDSLAITFALQHVMLGTSAAVVGLLQQDRATVEI